MKIQIILFTGRALLLTNSVGVIDSGYRGEIKFKFKRIFPQGIFGEDNTIKMTRQPDCYYRFDRIGQLIIMPIPDIEFEEAEELSDSDRGTGGYGSTGM